MKVAPNANISVLGFFCVDGFHKNLSLRHGMAKKAAHHQLLDTF